VSSHGRCCAVAKARLVGLGGRREGVIVLEGVGLRGRGGRGGRGAVAVLVARGGGAGHRLAARGGVGGLVVELNAAVNAEAEEEAVDDADGAGDGGDEDLVPLGLLDGEDGDKDVRRAEAEEGDEEAEPAENLGHAQLGDEKERAEEDLVDAGDNGLKRDGDVDQAEDGDDEDGARRRDAEGGHQAADALAGETLFETHRGESCCSIERRRWQRDKTRGTKDCRVEVSTTTEKCILRDADWDTTDQSTDNMIETVF